MNFNLKNLSFGALLLTFALMLIHALTPAADLSPPDQSGISVSCAGIFGGSTFNDISSFRSMHRTADMWQPPVHDASMQGVGTDDDPIGVDHSKYLAVLSQASTSAPTAVVVDNELSGAGAYTYTSTGIYVWELDDAFTANKTFVTTSVGNATGLVAHAYSITDSTVVIKIFDAAGAAANLAGTMYLEVDVFP
ncbi:MAG TPA: hypothetical protein VFG10_18955 [Saprospiraceae bacterium]|nr:hypothetical protein [Saprospiraceae bacterium]